MWPWTIVPVALLALIPLAAPAQIPLQSPPVHAYSHTLLDALSDDPDYHSLIKLLQHAKLVPTLNRLNGSTLFAPTNDAISKHKSWQAVLDDPHDLRDNVQEELRQQLFYHILNYTIPALPTEQTFQTHKTLLYPRTPTEPPTREQPPGPPWMPLPGGTLGGEPQRLRAAYREDAVWVGVDSSGKQGAEVVKESVETANGLLVGINDVLDMPPDLATVVSQHPSLSYLGSVLTPEIRQFLNSTSSLTLFLPVDAAWEALPYYERMYLQSRYATDELTRIVRMHAVARKHVKYAESFASGANLTTLNGSELQIVPSDNSVTVSGAELTESDIYASNGVIHAVSSLLVPEDALQLTPEKYLLTLNCSAFVSSLHSVGLASLVNDTKTEYTILAPSDDVINLFGDDGSMPKNGTAELRRTLRYHFIPGKWPPDKLKDGILLKTALEEDGLGGDKQVLAVEANGQHVQGNSKGKSVRFGGAGTIGDPVEVNNTLIYLISRPLVPPADALQTALPELELSSFLAAIFSTSLAEKLKTIPRTTLLMPPNSAFKRLGMLVSAHLLAASSRADLERVIEHHALKEVMYGSTLGDGSQRTFGTLEGSDIHAERGPNGSVVLSASGGWAGMQAALVPRDMLTQTGVIHEVSDIMIPRSVQLTIGKLVKAAKGTTMATMIAKAGFDWVLNGTSPPTSSPWSEQGFTGSGWTLLCPTDDAFKPVNLTALYADEERLQAIVSQHLIPSQDMFSTPPDLQDVWNNNRPLAMDDGASYKTLQTDEDFDSGNVVFRKVEGEENGVIVGVGGANGDNGKRDWARVLSWGRATVGGGTGGVVQIDRLLEPYNPPWHVKYGAPVAVGVLGAVLICAFFYGVRAFWRRDTTEATYEPRGGFAQDDTEES